MNFSIKKEAIRKARGIEFGQSFHFGNNYKKYLIVQNIGLNIKE